MTEVRVFLHTPVDVVIIVGEEETDELITCGLTGEEWIGGQRERLKGRSVARRKRACVLTSPLTPP